MTQHINDAHGDEIIRPYDTAPAEDAREPASIEQPDVTAALPDASSASSASDDTESLPDAPAKRARRKSNGASKPQAAKAPAGPESPAPPAQSTGDATGDAMQDLEAKGFTEAEAARLIYLSDHAAQSAEAREAEATLRRLRFTRWLIERGRLDEWSA